MSDNGSDRTQSQGISNVPPPTQLPSYLMQHKRTALVPPTPPQLHPIITNINLDLNVNPVRNDADRIVIGVPNPPMLATSDLITPSGDKIELDHMTVKPDETGPNAFRHASPAPDTAPSSIPVASVSFPAAPPLPPPLVSTTAPTISLTPPTIPITSSSNEDPAKTTDAMLDERSEESGMFGWLQQTVKQSQFLANVANKAMSGMDSMLTTLDPGMKSFLHDDSPMASVIVDCANSSVCEALLNGFNQVFTGVNMQQASSTPSQTLPPQIVGYQFAGNAVKERLAILRANNPGDAKLTFLVVQPFLQQIENIWFDTALIVAESGDQQSCVLTQGIQIDSSIIETLKKHTPKDYTANAFATTIGYAYAELFGCSPEKWQNFVLPMPAAEFYLLAAITLATRMKRS